MRSKISMQERLSKDEFQEVERHRSRLSIELNRDVDFTEASEHWLKTCAVTWREKRQSDMLARQREEILKHKWIESEKAHRDLGSEATLDWIRRYAAQWREWYEEQYDAKKA